MAEEVSVMSAEDLIQRIDHLGTISIQRADFELGVFENLVLYRLKEMASDAELAELFVNETGSTTPIEETIADYKIVIDESLLYGRCASKFDTGLLDMQKLMKRCGLNTDRITPTIVQKKKRFRWRHYFEITFSVT